MKQKLVLEKINKIDKLLSTLTKKQRDNIQINKVEKKLRITITDRGKPKIIRSYF